MTTTSKRLALRSASEPAHTAEDGRLATAATTASALVVERATWEVLAVADSVGADATGESARAWGTVEWGGGAVVASDSAGRVLVRVPAAGGGP